MRSLLLITIFLIIHALHVSGLRKSLFEPKRFISFHCRNSAVGNMDPIVTPGAPSSHSHDFFGANVVSTTTTIEEMLDSNTTCDNAIDKSMYWAPSLYFKHGDKFDRVPASHGSAYYRPLRSNLVNETITGFPPGFKMVGNSNFDGHTAFYCISKNRCSLVRSDKLPLTKCHRLRLNVKFQNCWNGQEFDQNNVNGHVAYSNEKGVCPPEFPFYLPNLTLEVNYEVDQYEWTPDGVSQPFWLANNDNDGSKYHADFFSGWDMADRIKNSLEQCTTAVGTSGQFVQGTCPFLNATMQEVPKNVERIPAETNLSVLPTA